jgi:hypothetical protein
MNTFDAVSSSYVLFIRSEGSTTCAWSRFDSGQLMESTRHGSCDSLRCMCMMTSRRSIRVFFAIRNSYGTSYASSKQNMRAYLQCTGVRVLVLSVLGAVKWPALIYETVAI